ncbi:unnamed protein product [Pleuronectes platessa]|uniref:Uncharacterized protein n=1 Tax=Pleuronectes platessa TaxID=8262 RepID=A0A9N7UZ58_PLEPL|nr:unnamed protein product [Pleuronectes platessa]
MTNSLAGFWKGRKNTVFPLCHRRSHISNSEPFRIASEKEDESTREDPLLHKINHHRYVLTTVPNKTEHPSTSCFPRRINSTVHELGPVWETAQTHRTKPISITCHGDGPCCLARESLTLTGRLINFRQPQFNPSHGSPCSDRKKVASERGREWKTVWGGGVIECLHLISVTGHLFVARSMSSTKGLKNNDYCSFGQMTLWEVLSEDLHPICYRSLYKETTRFPRSVALTSHFV